MDIGGASSNPSIVDTSPDDDRTPLKRFIITTQAREKSGKGNASWKCKFCQLEFKGSYSRVKAHLLQVPNQGVIICKKVDAKKLSELRKVVEDAEARLKAALPKNVSLPSIQASMSSGSQRSGVEASNPFLVQGIGFGTKKRKSGPMSQIEKSYNKESRQKAHELLARFFYSAGLPFVTAKNPYFINAVTYLANNPLVGYVPPGYNLMRTSLLREEKNHIERLLQPIKDTWKEKGVTVVCDGWSDPQRRPLINFMAVTESGPMFLKAVNCEGEYKDKYFIRDEMLKVIEEVGPQNVVQIITDNAPVCKAAGVLVEGVYSHIFWTPCVVHTLNLAFKNICAAKNTSNNVAYGECAWIKELSDEAQIIKNFIMNHSMRLAMFNEFSHLKFLQVAETRFASVIVMLRRFAQIKSALQKMVISEHWSSYKEDDVEKARFVREKILDETWWDNLNYILSFTEPIYSMLRKADTDAPSLHLIYDMWDTMIEKVKANIYRHEKLEDNEECSFYSVIYNILVDRWNKSNTPLHCLAHSLNPR